MQSYEFTNNSNYQSENGNEDYLSDALADISYSSEKNNDIWDTFLDIRYSTNWRFTEKKWNQTFSLHSTHNINLSKNWVLSYAIDFNIMEKEIIRNEISIKRPIHCWEFSFSYWPGNSYSSGFSLQINVLKFQRYMAKICYF